jgi:ferredoxin
VSTRIYHFSGTGNSLWAARTLAEHMDDCSLEPMVSALAAGGPVRPSEDRIGLVFPVYMYRMPHLVRRFVEALETSAPIFALATCGGDACDLMAKLERRLKRRGMTLRSGNLLRMQSNYTPFGEPPPEPELSDKLAKAQEHLAALAPAIAAGSASVEREYSWRRAYVHPGMLYRLGHAMVPKTDKDFVVDDRCNGCGLCAKVCPVGNLVMAGDRPSWNSRCEQCFACLQWCPKEAIEVGEKTAGRRRYHHPTIKAKDIAAQKTGA